MSAATAVGRGKGRRSGGGRRRRQGTYGISVGEPVGRKKLFNNNNAPGGQNDVITKRARRAVFDDNRRRMFSEIYAYSPVRTPAAFLLVHLGNTGCRR